MDCLAERVGCARNPLMRVLKTLAASLLLAPLLHGDPLTQADREALIEKLTKIQEGSDKRVEERFSAAINAYRSAMASDDATLEFYLKCVEKLQFDDKNKKGQDFREWKRKQEGQLQNPGFRRALRHQLRWLTLTLQVASSKEPPTKFAAEAAKAVDDVFADINAIDGERDLLRQPVLSTLFAQVYELSGTKVPEWPLSPIELGPLYNKIILPPLRKPDRIEELRAAWTRRIQQETLVIEHWTRGGDEKPGKDGSRSPEQEKFVTETYPEYLWLEEQDVFKAGDQRGAALKMFQHLEKYALHPKVGDWTRQFKELLDPKPVVTPAAGE